MPKIIPFKGVRYNQEKIGKMSLVVAPPYDIIPPKMQDVLYKAHPKNVVRLILNKITPSDTETDNRYIRAKKFFEEWLKENILVHDARPAFYIYVQEYKHNGKAKEQAGFVGLMELDMKGDKVLAHENTLAAPKQDRLKLMKETHANLSPIFILYDDKARKIASEMDKFRAKNKPVIDVKFEGVRNIVWRLDDASAVKKIERIMSAKKVFIADGHHRYETSRMYAREIEGSDLAQHFKDNSKYLMVYFVESDERALTVLPTHRMVKDIGALTIGDIKSRLGENFTIKKFSSLKSMMSALEKGGSHSFGMYARKDGFYILKLKDIKEVDALVKDRPRVWRRLDVSILHLFIFKNILGISDSDDNIEFSKDSKEAAEFVDKGKCKIAFFLNPATPGEVKEIAAIGERMPRKATYFYPKPLSGLVINKH